MILALRHADADKVFFDKDAVRIPYEEKPIQLIEKLVCSRSLLRIGRGRIIQVVKPYTWRKTVGRIVLALCNFAAAFFEQGMIF